MFYLFINICSLYMFTRKNVSGYEKLQQQQKKKKKRREKSKNKLNLEKDQ